MKTVLCTCIVSMLVCVPLISQPAPTPSLDTVFRVRISGLGAVMATNYDKPPTAQSTTTTYLGNTLGGRIVWHPNHLLAVGVQSGFVFFSTDDLVINGIESGRAGLAAIPIQMVLTMSSNGFEFGVGLGMYQLQSIWRMQGIQRAASSDYEYGVNPWLGYEFAMADRLSIGPELGAHILSNRGMKALYMGVKVTGDVVRY